MDPKITKAAILFKQDEPLIVDDITMPENLLAGQVLVELLTSGICGSQLGEISGVKGDDPYLPHLMGHEGCGNVLDIGPGVKNVQIGDRVVLHWRKGNGIQSETPIYKWRGSTLNAGWVTTFNKHAVISENRCTKISKDIDPCEAALFGCAVTTGFGVIENNAKIKIGESVLIFGSGGKVIREICETTGAKVDIEDDGTVKIAASDNESSQAALKKINDIVAEAELGVIYTGKVVKTVDFGAFVNFLGTKDGLVHISELQNARTEKTTDICKEGDIVKVKVIGFDDRGKVKLSMKRVDQETGEDIENVNQDN